MIKSLFQSKKSNSPQEQTILYVTKVLREKSHKDIKAATPEFALPKKVVRESTGEGFIPEVTAIKDDNLRLFAVETKETLFKPETLQRWRLFAEYAKQNNAIFYVVFPAGFVSQVKQKIEASNIEARLWQAAG